jgi:hypothetical protein
MAVATIQIRSVLVQNVGMELSEKMALSNVATAKFELIEIMDGLLWCRNLNFPSYIHLKRILLPFLVDY